MADLLDFPLMGGQDNSVEPTVASKPTLMENCWYSKVNGVQRRFGVTKLNTNSTIDAQKSPWSQPMFTVEYDDNTTPLALAALDGELYLQGDANIWKYEPSEACWLHTQVCPTVAIEVDQVSSVADTYIDDSVTTPRIFGVDSHSVNGYVGIAWIEEAVDTAGTTYSTGMISVYRESTGEAVLTKTFNPQTGIVSGAFTYQSQIRVTRSGTNLVFVTNDNGGSYTLMIFDTTDNSFRVSGFPSSSPGFGTATAVRAFDVAYDRSGSGRIAIFGAHGGGWCLITLTSAFAVAGSAINFDTLPAAAEGFAVEFDTYVYVAYDNAAGLRARVYDNAAAAVTAITLINATRPRKVGIWPNGTTDVTFIWNAQTAGGGYTDLIASRWSSALGVQENLLDFAGINCLMVSKPVRTTVDGVAGIKFLASAMGRSVTGVTSNGVTGALVYVFMDRDWTSSVYHYSPLVLGVVEPTYGLAHNGQSNDGGNTVLLPLPSTHVGSSSVFSAYPFGGDADTGRITDVRLAKAEIVNQVRVRGALGCNFSSGGVPRCYDGALNQEVCSLGYPYISSTTATAGGSLSTDSAYSAAVCYAFTNSKGLTHRSSPAISDTVTPSGANLTLTVVCSNIDVGTNVRFLRRGRLEAYRTQGNQSTYYAEKVVDLSSNTITTSSTITLSISDTAVSDNQQLYTEGGVLDNVAPPGGRSIEIHGQRLWVGGTPDDSIWYSKEFVTGEMPGFSEGMSIQPFEGGRVVALASLDASLVIFKRNSIHVVTGSGPDDTGSNGAFSLPFQVQSDTGCKDRMSVVECPLGVLFRGERGIYLLDRSQTVQYVGRPIEDALVDSVTITNAVFFEKHSQVWFATDTNTAYIYDILNDAWSTYVFKKSDGTDLNPRVMTVLNGTLYMVDSSLNLWKYDLTKSLDDSTYFFVDKYRTQFLTAPASQDWQRIRAVNVKGTKLEQAGLSVTLYFDYDTNTSESRSWTFTETEAFGPTTNRQVRVIPRRQKCQSVAVEISNVTPTSPTTGYGWRFQALTLEVEPRRGPSKLRATQTK